jgi:hypothetical protein
MTAKNEPSKSHERAAVSMEGVLIHFV